MPISLTDIGDAVYMWLLPSLRSVGACVWPWLPERVVVVHIPCVLLPPPGVREKAGRRQSTGLMQRVCNAPLKELPATLPSTHLTHANSLHTATAVPHIPRPSQTAQAGSLLRTTSFSCSLGRFSFSLGRGLTACASALGAHFRLRQLGRGRGALWRLGGRHLHLVGRGVDVLHPE